MTEAGAVNDPERCPRTKHVDGKSHGWLGGDDPYIKCDWCGEIRDALTGQVAGLTWEDHGRDADNQTASGTVRDPIQPPGGSNGQWRRDMDEMPTIRMHQAPSEIHIQKEAGQDSDGLPYPRIEPHYGCGDDGTSAAFGASTRSGSNNAAPHRSGFARDIQTSNIRRVCLRASSSWRAVSAR